MSETAKNGNGTGVRAASATQLISLSLNYFATYELYHIKPRFASKLVRLDWMAIATDEDWNLMRFDNFPCLEELRLGRQFAESTSCSLIATSSDSQLFQDETDFAVRVSTLLIRLFLGVLTCIYIFRRTKYLQSSRRSNICATFLCDLLSIL